MIRLASPQSKPALDPRPLPAYDALGFHSMPDPQPPQPGEKVCPQCGSARVHRSHRRGFLERVLLPLIGRRPFRCADCGHRFLASRHAHSRRRLDQG